MISSVLLLCLALLQPDAVTGAWTWKTTQVSSGEIRSRSDLDAILQGHKQWLDSGGRAGQRANLQGADLRGAPLHGADLRRADLSQAWFDGADLSEADLRRASLFESNFERADLRGANLTGTEISVVIFNNATLAGANLANAHVLGMRDANLENANLTSAEIYVLVRVNLKGAVLDRADLRYALYEPSHNPDAKDIATAKGLETLRYQNDGPIRQLRKELSDAGFEGAARLVTASIHRNNESLFERVLFDWTCEWGLAPVRPLYILFALCGCCTFVYWLGPSPSSRQDSSK